MAFINWVTVPMNFFGVVVGHLLAIGILVIAGLLVGQAIPSGFPELWDGGPWSRPGDQELIAKHKVWQDKWLKILTVGVVLVLGLLVATLCLGVVAWIIL